MGIKSWSDRVAASGRLVDLNLSGENDSAIENRFASLFDGARVADRSGGRSKKRPFNLIPSQFLQLAASKVPECPYPTASQFSDWVYSIYGSGTGSEKDRDAGKVAEEEIFSCRKWLAPASATLTTQKYSEWALIHNGLHLATGSGRPFEVPDLKVRGQPLKVCPDLLYQNRTTGEVVIVEIKFSRMNVPSNLWPNVWAQLWCYAQIPVVRDAPRAAVIGEVWRDAGEWEESACSGFFGREWSKKVTSIGLIASVRRDPRNPAFDTFFRKLFNIYRGD